MGNLELHEGSFEVNNPEKYRVLVENGSIHKECEERGNTLQSLKEVRTGVWEYAALINTANPRLNEIATLLRDLFQIEYTLASVPRVKPVYDEDPKAVLKDLRMSVEAL